ncbi:6-phosphogluconate dehydrogenase [Thiogranum longum]|uniref:6-phosphogluconate dehydrogenase n=1 Tax=Thiogranum longum TaxID=1537524 RepID=A0A4R1HHB7_9GAMM|nr:decarboxylating 6-phosphogluconate dehydrogenase [Thiogranum longum]TCK18779.1 6-phosphogluconate dehydrogenase [Thiogranum longum]
MQMGMIGLGRMGANMVRRLIRDGHSCVVHNRSHGPVEQMVSEGAIGSENLDDFLSKLDSPRVVWLMVPAAAVGQQIDILETRLDAGDIVIDGGNSWYKDDIVRARRLGKKGIHYLDVGTSGGVWGLERGYCLMIGGNDGAVKHINPLFATLAPGTGDIERTAGREGERSTSELGYLHCGPAGAGHFVKMVHNGIEYGLMAAYAEGFNILKHAGIGKQSQDSDAETSPLRNPEEYQYDIDLPEVAELWRRGSVISSWLLDLTATALRDDAELGDFSGQVSDSGEGRWTSIAAIEIGAPAPLLTTALYNRFSSRGEADFADKILSAMRFQFGGHHEKGKG